ncbi:hypothetical protein BU24DRAFT_360313 [Aaosphaeria arxii CBS 175.79]|uniref:Lipocalin-like domain-containing protein n=1 Tax=Aaosphaeria arxii CBS 175.79 TaxID=1450172 RepID=A0A6A5X6P3_9PLEO|nr:uncharacterized protein BU24DRAFT_360313 [Aaosphaeria arxii CBS 175.79]KAF2008517.1 hypothetical protein BU24DRAFT_360313 [Aaosphaeria arxii CBS 175.79]
MTPPLAIVQILSGTWSLINNTSLRNGTILPGYSLPTGANPAGLIHYSATGYMSANIMDTNATNRPTRISWPPKDTDSDSDWALVGRHAMSYSGPYSVEVWNETHGTLTHGPLVYAATPSMVGTNQKRNYTLYEDGDVLKLNFHNYTAKTEGTLFWRRLAPSWEHSYSE